MFNGFISIVIDNVQTDLGKNVVNLIIIAKMKNDLNVFYIVVLLFQLKLVIDHLGISKKRYQ